MTTYQVTQDLAMIARNAIDCIRQLERDRHELLHALKALIDEQEGPPLIRRHRQWQAAVDACRAAIAKAEGGQE